MMLSFSSFLSLSSSLSLSVHIFPTFDTFRKNFSRSTSTFIHHTYTIIYISFHSGIYSDSLLRRRKSAKIIAAHSSFSVFLSIPIFLPFSLSPSIPIHFYSLYHSSYDDDKNEKERSRRMKGKRNTSIQVSDHKIKRVLSLKRNGFRKGTKHDQNGRNTRRRKG